MLLHVYDSINASAVPGSPAMGYVDGNPNWRSYPRLVARFGALNVLSITVTGLPGARILDWERGNADPPQWCADELRAGRRPTIYCDLSSRGAVDAAIAPLFLGGPWVDWACADWTGLDHIVPGSVLTQWAHDLPPGYDLSTAESSWIWPGLGDTLDSMPGPAVDAQGHVHFGPLVTDNGDVHSFEYVPPAAGAGETARWHDLTSLVKEANPQAELPTFPVQ